MSGYKLTSFVDFGLTYFYKGFDVCVVEQRIEYQRLLVITMLLSIDPYLFSWCIFSMRLSECGCRTKILSYKNGGFNKRQFTRRLNFDMKTTLICSFVILVSSLFCTNCERNFADIFFYQFVIYIFLLYQVLYLHEADAAEAVPSILALYVRIVPIFWKI